MLLFALGVWAYLRIACGFVASLARLVCFSVDFCWSGIMVALVWFGFAGLFGYRYARIGWFVWVATLVGCCADCGVWCLLCLVMV